MTQAFAGDVVWLDGQLRSYQKTDTASGNRPMSLPRTVVLGATWGSFCLICEAGVVTTVPSEAGWDLLRLVPGRQ